MARAAEEAGFDSIWLGDHLLYRDARGERGPWEVWTQLAALAAITDRVRLGRFVLGIGSGWNDVEFRAFGFPLDRRVSRFEEAFEIVRRLLSGEHVTFAGEFFAVEDAVVLPAPARRVPLMLGANAPRMLSIALPHVDVWNTWYTHYGNTVEGFVEHNAYVSEQAVRASRDPAEIERSACVLVRFEGGEDPRPEKAPPVEQEALHEHLGALGEAGADEAILVVNPITERSIRGLAELI